MEICTPMMHRLRQYLQGPVPSALIEDFKCVIYLIKFTLKTRLFYPIANFLQELFYIV